MPSSSRRYKIGDHPFVDDSIRVRLPKILDSLAIDEDTIIEWIKQTKLSLANDTFVIQKMDGSDGGPSWEQEYPHYIGKMSKDVDWFFLENYFYRIILRKFNYYSTRIDPFKPQKEKSLSDALKSFEPLTLSEAVENSKVFEKLLLRMLWGNRSDLSLSGGVVESVASESSQKHLLINNSPQIAELLLAKNTTSIGIVLDNCGMELLNDLEFVYITMKKLKHINFTLYCKPFPVFVSDALKSDVMWHIQELKSISNDHDIFSAWLEQGRLNLEDHSFFCGPRSFCDMPQNLKDSFENHDLVIFKGDANYRRLLGDIVLPMGTDFFSIVNYLDTSVATIRTCKSPIISNIDKKKESELTSFDQDWKVNGKFGLILSNKQ